MLCENQCGDKVSLYSSCCLWGCDCEIIWPYFVNLAFLLTALYHYLWPSNQLYCSESCFHEHNKHIEILCHFFLRKSTLWDLYPVFTLFQSSAAKDVPAKSLIFICQEVWIHDLYPLAWGVLIYSISWYFFYIQQLWLLFTLQHTTVITIQHSSKTRQVPRWVRDLNQKIHLRIDRLGPESEPTRLNRPSHGTSRNNSADSAELSPSQSRVKLSVVHP